MSQAGLGSPKQGPFHETILRAIQRPPSGEDRILDLMELIMETHVPKGHDAIVDEVEKYCAAHGIANKYDRELSRFMQHMQRMKRELADQDKN